MHVHQHIIVRFPTMALILMLMISVCSCKDDGPVVARDYVRFAVDNKSQDYKFADSLFHRCELHVGSGDKFVFSYDQTFKSTSTDFYSITIDLNNSDSQCPETAISEHCQFSFDLVKQNASKQFIDYFSKPTFNVEWSQKFENSRIIISGTFEGYLYQYFKTRPSGAEVPPAPTLLDSVYVDKGVFQISIPH